tara:strand:- start:264 stop:2234 length:1971 start_codon:yes stop_codon:yes gene_type:complete
VGQIIDSSADIVCFLVDGLFGFLEDTSYSYPWKRSTPFEFRRKIGVVCAFRLLSKEVRQEVDHRIEIWMRKFYHSSLEIQAMFTKMNTLMREWLVDVGEQSNEQSGECKAAIDHYVAKKDDFKRFLDECFSVDLRNKVTYDLEHSDRLTRLDFSVSTFMCMATERCQVHAPIGACSCCSSLNRKKARGSRGDFTELRFGSMRVTVYASEKCVNDVFCIKPRDGLHLLRDDDKNISVNTVRAMFRMSGVYHPFHPEKINMATKCWGEPATESWMSIAIATQGAMRVSRSTWPERIMLFRHPCISDKRTSIQDLLGLTDSQAKTCHNDAIRKKQQHTAREEAAKKRRIDELCADVDAYMAYMAADDSFPVSSLEELGSVCSGMEESIRMAILQHTDVSVAPRKGHGLDIECVRDGLWTVKYFLCWPVISADRSTCKETPLCSAEAYDYMSGMHVARYGTITPCWAPTYADLKGAAMFGKVPSGTYFWRRGEKHLQGDLRCTVVGKAVCMAMRFFDALDTTSLTISESHPNDSAAHWLLSNKHMSGERATSLSVDFSPSVYDNVVKMDADIRRLVSAQQSDIALPVLFSAHTHVKAKLAIKNAQSDAARDAVQKWYTDCYRLLVEDPGTRCAALDLLGIRPVHLIEHVMRGGGDGELLP